MRTQEDLIWSTVAHWGQKNHPKPKPKVHISSKWLPVEIQSANFKQRLGLSREAALPSLFYLVAVLLKLASFLVLSFYSFCRRPPGIWGYFLSQPSVRKYCSAFSFCDTDNHSSWTPRFAASQRTLPTLSCCFLMWHWLNLFLRSECSRAPLSLTLWPFQRTKLTYNATQVFQSNEWLTSVFNTTGPEGLKLHL